VTVRGADYVRRKNDDYPTPPEVIDVLFDNVSFTKVLDPACGKLKRVVKAAERAGLVSYSSDIIYGANFFETEVLPFASDIVTNPPYGDRRGSLALRFIEHALELTKPGRNKIAMLLPIDFDSGKTRQHVFAHRAFALKIVLLDRIRWFDGQSGSTNHAWFVWDWQHKGPPIIKYARINYGGKHVRHARSNKAHRSVNIARSRTGNRRNKT
jgi:hypothetical protein